MVGQSDGEIGQRGKGQEVGDGEVGEGGVGRGHCMMVGRRATTRRSYEQEGEFKNNKIQKMMEG